MQSLMLHPADPLPSSLLTDWELTAIAARMVQRPDCNIYVAEQIGRPTCKSRSPVRTKPTNSILHCAGDLA